MRNLKTDVTFGAYLDVRELSFIRSFAKGGCVSSIYTPPITAEFLRRVSFKVSHGEVHGIIGASGSGKSTLLKVIAGRLEGKVDGVVWLNGQLLTKPRFSALCEYVDLNSPLLPNLTVEQTLHYHARLALNCKPETVNYRVFTLMQQFDLGPIAEKVVNSLKEADSRRLVIAMHLVRDPVLVIIDDPIKNLDALSAFQLMSSLQDYCKRQARMALVSMKCPRSDIYQLLTQLTLLFYGEVVYSGPSKQMPHYFNSIGFKCPSVENPAVYYLSLASVDRETPESYAETQTKAMKLAEIFRERRDSLPLLNPPGGLPSEMPILSCFYGAPSNASRVATLFSRQLTYVGRSGCFVFGQFILPLIVLILALFGTSVNNRSWHIPRSIAGSSFALILFSGLAGVWATCIQFNDLRKSMFFENSLGLYNGILIFFVFLLLGVILDVLSVGMAAFSFVWKLTDDVQIEDFVSLFGIIWCAYYFYKLITLASFVCLRSSQKVLLFGTHLAVFMSIICSGFLKSYQSFLSVSNYMSPITYISIERFSNHRMAQDFVNATKVQNCSRDEFHEFSSVNNFCRWTKGKNYLQETLPENITLPEWWIGPLLLVSVTFFIGAFFLLITQKCAQKRIGKFH
ncbi:hypothetical protein FO519_004275 [Halicephalobus sp. NKZ332]|nr:hypothetical protein FO519_004275 [Halicephalobus sp. NKZ332]